jgi:hypothetical protein
MTASMLFALPAVWLACAVAGYLYSQQQGIPAWMFRAAIGAILLEITFYYVMGVEALRTPPRTAPAFGCRGPADLAARRPT